jgi:hypothetical protein
MEPGIWFVINASKTNEAGTPQDLSNCADEHF